MIGAAAGRRILALLPVLMALAGCASSPPVAFYALASVKTPPLHLIDASPLQIARVHLAPMLDRREIVRQSGSVRIEVSDQHRWSAPLDQMIRRSLSEDLLDALPPGELVLPQEPAPAHTRKVVIDILRFIPDAQGQVRLEASWSTVPDDGGTALRSAVVHITTQMSSMSYAAQVEAMSRAIAKLAETIARQAG